MSEAQWTRLQGAREIRRIAQSRLCSLVEFARVHSALYRERYRDLPHGEIDAAALAPVGKRELMHRFDDWVTDPAIRRGGVEKFVADPGRIGDLYAGRYAVWKSSGSTGEPGLFVHDVSALATYDAMIAAQIQAPAVAAAYAFGIVAHAGRAALIAATGEHFASISSWRRLARTAHPGATVEMSVMQPVAEWVDALNRHQPAFIASYSTVLALLAAEQVARRLKVSPAIVWAGGEQLTEAARRAIERAFGCLVIDEYGASECLSMAFGCPAGWLHVNADWVIVEPVDRDYRASPPGELSHTALLTNLANRVQPIIRYDIGDRVLANPRPCACGSPLPAIRIEGRCDEIVTLRRADGARVDLLPMALTTAIEEASGLHWFQIVQRDDESLAVRFCEEAPQRRRAVWQAARKALRTLLDRHALANVRVDLDALPPQPHPGSGKLRQVIAAQSHGHDARIKQAARAPSWQRH